MSSNKPHSNVVPVASNRLTRSNLYPSGFKAVTSKISSNSVTRAEFSMFVCLFVVAGVTRLLSDGVRVGSLTIVIKSGLFPFKSVECSCFQCRMSCCGNRCNDDNVTEATILLEEAVLGWLLSWDGWLVEDDLGGWWIV